MTDLSEEERQRRADRLPIAQAQQAQERPVWLSCSRGCLYRRTHPQQGDLEPGQRCSNITSYDRMNGSTYCRRILRVATPEEVAAARDKL